MSNLEEMRDWFLSRREAALREIEEERIRQDMLKIEGRFPFTAADDGCPEHMKLGMLVEEVGEVARAQQGGHDSGDLKKEVAQVGAIALAWLEGLS